ncbi:MAG TPA: galactose oxidase-like domain-containing protein, partial [Acidimicrobiia bacterium]|nr:galactose oxidase-like domain-containing protein [Acidimicrobiia bacterium]
PVWSEPSPVDAGANPSGSTNDPLLPPPLSSTEPYNDGALFCSSLTFLPDGRLLAAGGTAYYDDPALISKYGVIELEGMANSRIYNPQNNTWTQAGDMNYGRWYPSTVALPDGDVFVASGVKRLIKTMYPDQAIDGGDPVDAATDSGRNVVDTETFDTATATWTENPDSADRSLPLYPRLHLLPNGKVYFNAAGQVFNPDGYAYDEYLWNQAAAYDPASQTWADLGIPGVGTPAPGFRGSTFSIMLPLAPDAAGSYTEANFLTAGGILGTSPGTYFAVTDSRIDTVDTTDMSLTSASTGALNQPRWYGTGVLTPTGEVIAFSGASADEVVGPGTAIPVTEPELWNPTTGEWTQLAGATEKRTYHNTAALLPDGRILVGGHAPISTLYGNNTTLVEGTTTPQETRNPTFEIFEPPYLFRGERPSIDGSPASAQPGQTIPVTIDIDGADVESVVLMRKTAITHLVDGGQRSIVLPITERKPNKVTVQIPAAGGVVPAGPYLLFVNQSTPNGPVPSVAEEIRIEPSPAVSPTLDGGATALVKPRDFARPVIDLAKAGGVAVDDTLAFHEIAEVMGIPHHTIAARDHGGRRPGSPFTALAVGVGLCGLAAVARRRASARRLHR